VNEKEFRVMQDRLRSMERAMVLKLQEQQADALQAELAHARDLENDVQNKLQDVKYLYCCYVTRRSSFLR